MTLHSYSSIYAVGHRAAKELFSGPVVVEEKIDGSQFSFGLSLLNELHARSKGKELILDAPEKMFNMAVESIKQLDLDHGLMAGWTYRAEFLNKPKHNTLAYGRIPEKGIIIFDIDRGDQDYLSPDEKRTEAGRLGLEVVPVMFEGVITSAEQLLALMAETSCLGGTKPEGLVVKNYAQYDTNKKTLMGKYVTEAFKESHGTEWKKSNPGKGDLVWRITEMYKTDARWKKAVQHLRENGSLTDSPKDIGPLLKEVGRDVLAEEEQAIKDQLFKWAWPQVQRGITAGLPEWYKLELLKEALPPTDQSGLLVEAAFAE